MATAGDDIREIVLKSEISTPPLPEGDATVAGVHLGFGSRIGDTGWVTNGPVPSSGEAWARIAEAFPTTGLWPIEVEISFGPGMPLRPEELQPTDVSVVDNLVAAEVFERLWSETAFARVDGWPEAFPGLATADFAERPAPIGETAYDSYLLLVPVHRPADVPAVLGWTMPYATSGELSAVLRSWEDRFGWRLQSLSLGPMRVARGSMSLDDANEFKLLAEMVALGPEFMADLAPSELLAYGFDWAQPEFLFFSW